MSETFDEATTLKRRTFVAASTAVAGLPLLSSDRLPTATAAATPAPADRLSTVRLTVNGEQRTARVDNRTSLLDLLREHLDLPGTKKGCDQGACGACTVLVDDRRVNACLTLAVMHQGARVTTIEGLARGEQLHPLQQAFIDHDGLQCGYCTPGQVMSGVACIAEGHTGSRAEIREWMSGNLCRCGAYTNIVSAIEQTAKEA
ncbi:xanthine dehydrogenase YagT iron-sulfur-binding subunit [Streptomyces umbrinus]|uniref:(2Fe-2S)-binding protein n=1 Tax=Streptomyces umbrinus TaxID=67370 RepID=UPI00167D4D13|nr:(2Fe-2S)-binding protein [Streptomyces umbrinus]MCR3726638.1 xanthine dehydrogenase YagT iron-sulfur-binding subunit [Streptomyces umbrinus]GHH33561.1 carbon-monoxide dehydrogenase small subunit [Streptomyces umbrinus]